MFTRMITAALLAGTAALVGSTAAQSATLSSGAYAAGVKAGALSTVSADAVAGQSGGVTPGGYVRGGSLATLNQGASLATLAGTTVFERVAGSVATASATSDGVGSASGSVTLANPSLVLGTSTSLPFVPPLVLTALGITADAITSTSTVSVVNGMLVAGGDATIANLAFTGTLASALGLGGSFGSNPGRNTIYTLAGLTLALNEQIETPAAGALKRETNALRLSFDNYLLGGSTLTGDLILGHSEASITGFAPGAVPEPAGWATMIAGFGLLGAALRASRKPGRTVFA